MKDRGPLREIRLYFWVTQIFILSPSKDSLLKSTLVISTLQNQLCVCVCVCVCERERERDKNVVSVLAQRKNIEAASRTGNHNWINAA